MLERLELHHVGPPEGRLAKVEESYSRPVAGLDDLAPGDGADQPVGQEP